MACPWPLPPASYVERHALLSYLISFLLLLIQQGICPSAVYTKPQNRAIDATSRLTAERVQVLTFCMLSRNSDVLMLPSANLNLSRFATDSSPAFALIEGTLSPKKGKLEFNF